MTDEKALTVVEQRATVRYPSIQQWQLFERFAAAIYASHEFGTKTVEEIVIKAQYCWDYSLPLSAFNSLYIVNKRVAIQSDLIAQKMLSHPDYEYEVSNHTENECTVTVWRRSKRTGEFVEAGSVAFTMEDAKREGNASKDTYKKYPRDMMFARAITKAYKWHARNIFDVPVNTIEEFGYNEEIPPEGDVWAVEAKAIEMGQEGEVYVGNNNEAKEQELHVPPSDDDVPQYNITELAQLMELVKDADILDVWDGGYPTLPDEVNLAVHRLVEKDILKTVVGSDEMGEFTVGLATSEVKANDS